MRYFIVDAMHKANQLPNHPGIVITGLYQDTVTAILLNLPLRHTSTVSGSVEGWRRVVAGRDRPA